MMAQGLEVKSTYALHVSDPSTFCTFTCREFVLCTSLLVCKCVLLVAAVMTLRLLRGYTVHNAHNILRGPLFDDYMRALEVMLFYSKRFTLLLVHPTSFVPASHPTQCLSHAGGRSLGLPFRQVATPLDDSVHFETSASREGTEGQRQGFQPKKYRG